MANDATLAAAKAYRDSLNAQGIHYGRADEMVDAKYGAGTAQAINPHKAGGFAKYGGAVGDVAKVAAPFAAFIPGVGALGAAGLGALGGALGSLNDQGGPSVGGAAKGAGIYGAVGGLGGSALTGSKLPGLGNMGGGAGGSGALGGVWDFIKKNPQLAVGGALAGMSALQGAKQDKKAEERSDADYALRAPFREGLQGAMKPPPEPKDYTDVFGDLGNPYARPRLLRALNK